MCTEKLGEIHVFFFFFNLELKNSITRRNDMPEFNETSIYTPGPDDFP